MPAGERQRHHAAGAEPEDLHEPAERAHDPGGVVGVLGDTSRRPAVAGGGAGPAPVVPGDAPARGDERLRLVLEHAGVLPGTVDQQQRRPPPATRNGKELVMASSLTLTLLNIG